MTGEGRSRVASGGAAGRGSPAVRRRALAAIGPGAAGAGAALAACAPSGTGRGTGQGDRAAGPAPALPVPRTVEYWSRFGSGLQQEAQTAQAQRYAAANPGVTVNLAAMTDNIHEKTVAAVAAGTPPDVSNYDRFVIASYAVRGTFADLSALARRDRITGQEYYPAAWNEATFRGKLYALPYQTGVRALYFNRTHLQQAGIGADQAPKSLPELDQWALRLTVQEGDRYTRVGFIPWIGNSHFYTWGWLFGGEFYDDKTGKCTANQPRNIQALEWVGGYAQRYGNDRLEAFQGTFGQAQGGAFTAGLVTFFHTIQSQIDDARRLNPQLDFGVVPLPPAPNQTRTSTWSGGFGYVVPSGAKQPEAGWHFMRFLSSEEGELLWTRTTLALPVRADVARSAFWQEQARDARMKVFLDLLPAARWRPVMPAAQLLNDELNRAVNEVRAGKRLPKDVLEEVTQKVNIELATFPS